MTVGKSVREQDKRERERESWGMENVERCEEGGRRERKGKRRKEEQE